jgi:hypothetical protein
VTEDSTPKSALAGDVVERAADAYRALADLAETVEDESQYVNDLVDAYLPSIRALAGSEAGRPFDREQVAAVDEAIVEIELITDPHRAIDWLSTFPHVIALALGGEVDRPADGGDAGEVGHGANGDAAEPDDDSPFRMLRRDR